VRRSRRRLLPREFSFAMPAWTFEAGMVPWRHLVGLFRQASPVSFTVQDVRLPIYRREALP
jgi:hypothetical protein